MSPEYGSTCAIFPIDEETVRYLQMTGRPEAQVALVEAYAKEQGLWHDPATEPVYSETLELDLSTVVPSLAGPKRPQDRVSLSDAKASFRTALRDYVAHDETGGEDRKPGVPGQDKPFGVTTAVDEGSAQSFPASDAPAIGSGDDSPEHAPQPVAASAAGGERPSSTVKITMEDGTETEVDHGAVVIAAITSCTNTSNPSVMLGAALLAKKAVERGLERKPWVKTTLAPGSKVVMDYYERAGLTPYLEKLGFHLVGYGCTTCIGNSGPLPEPVSAAVNEADLAVVSVLSGNRNFEGRINPDVKMNYLASPAARRGLRARGVDGHRHHDRAAGPGHRRQRRVPSRHLAHRRGDRGRRRVRDRVRDVQPRLRRRLRRRRAVAVAPDPRRATRSRGTTRRRTCASRRTSTACRPQPQPVTDIEGARVLAKLGDSVTTDHISPAGSIKADSPAGRYLQEHGVARGDFNSYGSRRGNHEVMIRGTFANIRLRNQLAPGTEGGVTRDFTAGGEVTSIYDAAQHYAEAGTPLVVLAGKEYGSGSSATGPPRARRCSACAPSSRSPTSGSTAPTSSGWACCPCSSPTASPRRRWA
jgi:aconitate hydratase